MCLCVYWELALEFNLSITFSSLDVSHQCLKIVLTSISNLSINTVIYLNLKALSNNPMNLTLYVIKKQNHATLKQTYCYSRTVVGP